MCLIIATTKVLLGFCASNKNGLQVHASVQCATAFEVCVLKGLKYEFEGDTVKQRANNSRNRNCLSVFDLHIKLLMTARFLRTACPIRQRVV